MITNMFYVNLLILFNYLIISKYITNTNITIPLFTNCTIQEIKLWDSKSSLKSTSGMFTLAIIPTHSIMHSISFTIVTKWAKCPISSYVMYYKSILTIIICQWIAATF